MHTCNGNSRAHRLPHQGTCTEHACTCIRVLMLVQVACGSAISVARTDSGEVVSWGAAWRDPSRVDTVFPAGEVRARGYKKKA